MPPPLAYSPPNGEGQTVTPPESPRDERNSTTTKSIWGKRTIEPVHSLDEAFRASDKNLDNKLSLQLRSVLIQVLPDVLDELFARRRKQGGEEYFGAAGVGGGDGEVKKLREEIKEMDERLNSAWTAQFKYLHGSIREVVHERQSLSETLEKTYHEKLKKFEEDAEVVGKAMEERIEQFKVCEEHLVGNLKRTLDDRIVEVDRRAALRTREFAEAANKREEAFKATVDKIVDDKVDSLEDTFAAHSKALYDRVVALEARNKELERRDRESQERIHALESQQRKLEKALKKNSASIDELHDLVDAREEAEEGLDCRVKAIEGLFTSRAGEMQVLEDSVTDSKRRIEDLDKRYDELKRHTKKKIEKLAAQREEFSERRIIEIIDSETRTILDPIRTDTAKMEKSHDRLYSKYKSLDDEVSRLKSSTDKKISSLRHNLDSIPHQLEKTTSELKSFVESCTKGKTVDADDKDSLVSKDYLEKTLGDVTSRVNDFEKTLDDLEVEIEKVMTELRARDVKVDDVARSVADLKKKKRQENVRSLIYLDGSNLKAKKPIGSATS